MGTFQLPDVTKLKPRERILAVVGAAVVVIVLLDRLVLTPWAAHTRNVHQEIRKLEQELQTQQRLLARRGKVLGDLESVKPYLRPPVEDDLQMASLLREMEGLSAQSLIALEEIKPLAVETDGVARRYALDVRFAATPEQWADFIYRIEASPSLYAIERASLERSDESKEQVDGYLRITTTMVGTPEAQASDAAARATTAQ